jgi:hypothetical protein
MIPVSSKGFVQYEDEDGVIFKFKPKSGDVEDKLMTYYANDDKDLVKVINSAKELFNFVLLGWEDVKNVGMPSYPKDKNAAKLFTPDERTQILQYWHKANVLTPVEKKI